MLVPFNAKNWNTKCVREVTPNVQSYSSTSYVSLLCVSADVSLQTWHHSLVRVVGHHSHQLHAPLDLSIRQRKSRSLTSIFDIRHTSRHSSTIWRIYWAGSHPEITHTCLTVCLISLIPITFPYKPTKQSTTEDRWGPAPCRGFICSCLDGARGQSLSVNDKACLRDATTWECYL